MDIKQVYFKLSELLGPRVVAPVVKVAQKLPGARQMIDREYASLAQDMEELLKPYRDRFEAVREIPEKGRSRENVMAQMEEMRSLEEPRWKEGYVSGAVYHGDEDYIEFLNEVYAINSQSNPLHSDLWPSNVKFESEIVSMSANMLGGNTGGEIDPLERTCGVVTSGGTESILLAMKAYRDRARKRRGISNPEMVVPSTAHAAFDKAADYFRMEIKHVPVGDDFRADVEATRKAITRNTVVMVGSAPSFPHGVIDPIEPLSNIATEHGIGFHVDACLGGFVLPWAEKLGYDVPPFDFRLGGVTSISADTHKFGYAFKGTSVVLYRGLDLRHFQYFKTTNWPGGVYFTPTFAGSRPGALNAVCWAAMVSNGRDGYMDSTRRILETAEFIREGIDEIPMLYVLGDPLWVIAFASDELDVYEILDFMSEKGWNLNGLQNPPSVHICVTLRHTQAGVAERFLQDLEEASRHAGKVKESGERKIALYGMATLFPDKTLVERGLDLYMDTLYDS